MTANPFAPMIEEIAQRVAELLRPELAAKGSGAFYSQYDVPCSKRRYLDAARDGVFPSWRSGKLVLAKRVDVDAWLMSSPRPTRAPKPAAPATPAPFNARAALEAQGVVFQSPSKRVSRP